jgi:uncharacterized protein YuzE
VSYPYSVYDPTAEALYVYLSNEEITETLEVVPGALMIDLDAMGQPVGVEVIGPNEPFRYGEWSLMLYLSDYQIRFVANVVRVRHERGHLEEHPGNLANRLLAVIGE